jgi:hypothetical protein
MEGPSQEELRKMLAETNSPEFQKRHRELMAPKLAAMVAELRRLRVALGHPDAEPPEAKIEDLDDQEVKLMLAIGKTRSQLNMRGEYFPEQN